MIKSSLMYRRILFKSLAVIGIVGIVPLLVGAQNPVAVESLSETAAGASKSSRSAQTGVAFENQYQLQVLKQEVLELRGHIEQLNHQMREMKRLQENRYLDIDARLQTMGKRSGSSGIIDGGISTLPENPAFENTTASSGRTSDGSEQGLYESALAKIRIREYDGAISELQRLIERYPDGSFAPNAYYWLGEIYAAKPNPDYEKARQSLAQVISFFPDHRKALDAAFKLGKVYHLMGDCDRARELLENIVTKHQGKSVARLAEAYLREKLSCE